MKPRHKKIFKVMKANQEYDIELNGDEKALLMKYGTNCQDYIKGKEPQVFTKFIGTDADRREVKAFGALLDKLNPAREAIAGIPADRVNLIIIGNHNSG